LLVLKGLSGKTAIVTGAAGGIGSAVVYRLLEEGCKVVGVDLKLEAIERACSQADSDSFHPVVADVSTEKGCADYVEATVKRFGGVDLFANNAGILGRRLLMVDMPVEEFDRIMAVNLRGVFLGLQAVMRRMIEQKRGGAIVNTSSMGALKPYVNSSAYGVSKQGVIGLTKVAALENGIHGIRVNAVAPGSTDTSLLTAAFGADTATMFAQLPIPRVGAPAEIASMMAYLLSDEASYQTGGLYTVDGGLGLK